MTKTLVKHGNSYALVLDRAIMDLLNIRPESQLDISTDGTSLRIQPIDEPTRKARVRAAAKGITREYATVLRKLAQ